MVLTMTYTPDEWTRIEAQARKLGATDEQIRKWRERGGVASTWHARLIKADRKLLEAFSRSSDLRASA